ncbi:Sperm flagellar 1-like [Apodemus speciosus]|uniref:Sperm flagellar 1-like n=1 Tax=Apodemus speciosus TaxID=105296 RepID=A0ABQ0F0N3_APOSI
MVVRVRARRYGADDEEDSKLRATLALVLVAEIVKYFRPRLVDLHSYVPASSTDQKLSNWSLLNRKVFRKLHLCISDNDIQRVVSSRPGVIESILCALREKMEASTVHVGSAGTADAGHSSVDTLRPWGELTSHPHTTKIQDPNVDNSTLSEPLWDSCTDHHYIPENWAHDDLEFPNLQKKAGLQSPPAPSSMKILQNQRDLEKMGCCACRGDSIEGLWDHLVSIQQQLEDKEQALAILQETVKHLDVRCIAGFDAHLVLWNTLSSAAHFLHQELLVLLTIPYLSLYTRAKTIGKNRDSAPMGMGKVMRYYCGFGLTEVERKRVPTRACGPAPKPSDLDLIVRSFPEDGVAQGLAGR